MTRFSARGLVYLGAREFYEKHVPGGLAAVEARLDPQNALFLGQIFLGSSMYDALPIVPISAAAAEVAGISHVELVKRNAAWLAARDLRGVYKLLMHALPANAVALRLPKLALKYFNFGEATSRMDGEKCCTAEQHGIPEVMSRWFQACVQGFVPVALASAGAQSPRVRVLEQTSPSGGDTVSLRFEFRWG